jgi:hypothetical protein
MPDATLTAPIIAQWGAYGVILIALSGAVWMLAKALIGSYEARIGETKSLLQQKSDDARIVTDALKDMKATLDLALAALKGRP